MLVMNIDGALDCVLFLNELTLLVTALNAYQEECYEEIKAEGTQHAIEGLTAALELGAYSVSFSNATPPKELRERSNIVRKAIKHELIPDPEVAA